MKSYSKSFKLIVLGLMLLPMTSFAHSKGEIIARANFFAQEIQQKLQNNTLSEPQIYTYITALASFDKNIYGSALAFTPKFLQSHAFFLYNNVTADHKLLYSPYVDKARGQSIVAMDIGHIDKAHGYDYTKWAWFRAPLAQHKAMWSKPYYDKGAGNVKMVTYSIPIANIAVLTFDLAQK